MNKKSPFGLAEKKQEGRPLWPYDYLLATGRFPPKSLYSSEELLEQQELGYTDKEYSNE